MPVRAALPRALPAGVLLVTALGATGGRGFALDRQDPPGAGIADGLRVRWERTEDVWTGDAGASRAVFTIENRGRHALPTQGWALYFSALHQARPGSVSPGFAIEDVVGDLQRLIPRPPFPGLASRDRTRVEYLTQLLPNRSFAPAGPYLVFDDAPARGFALPDFAAAPFTRAPRPDAGPAVVTPEAQFALDQTVEDLPLEGLAPVLPSPLAWRRGEGVLRFTGPLRVSAAPGLDAEAALAREWLSAPFAGRGSAPPPAGVELRLSLGPIEGQPSPEAYELVVDPKKGIEIRGASPAGVFYGVQSLRALLLVPASAPGERSLPAWRIVDAPRFAYRGLMLDVARNFQPKAEVLRVLDLMARFKLNVLHFHLTEDEGWRLEIEGLPELTNLGARRGHTLDSRDFLPPAYGSGPDPDRPWGSGHYTRADYVEILRYAAARHIEVVPEIEMPGHARAAIKAMEARSRRRAAAGDEEGARRHRLHDPDDRSTYTSAQRYHDNVMNPALESTYTFVAHVVKAVVDLHREAGVPLRNLHVGGDEVPAGAWERSPAVAAFRKERGLTSVDDLWTVFYGRVAEILKAHDLLPSGWEELALHKVRRDGREVFAPNPGFAERGWRAYVWNNVPGGGNEDLAYRLANAGYKVVLCPVTHMYLDLAANPNPEEPGLDWGGFVDTRQPFEFVPLDYYKSLRQDQRGRPLDPKVFAGKERLTARGRANVVGLQANLWAETLGGAGRLDHMLLPKLLGLAERAWAQDSTTPSYSAFASAVGKRELPRLDADPSNWLYRIPTPGLKLEAGLLHASLSLPGFTLRYTKDGTPPTPQSPTLTTPIQAPPSTTFQVAAFDRRGRSSHPATLTTPR